MAKYLRPRRGSQANAIAQKILLKKGEMFLEFPKSEIGKGPGRLVIGDGATQYQNMNYATTATNVFRPFITDPEIFIPRFTNTEPSSSKWSVDAGTAAIAKMGNGSSTSTVTLPTIIGAIKETLCKHADSNTKLNNDLGDVDIKFDQYDEDITNITGDISDINTNLGKKANIASPTFTGTPKAPTAASTTNNTQIATTAFVRSIMPTITTSGSWRIIDFTYPKVRILLGTISITYTNNKGTQAFNITYPSSYKLSTLYSFNVNASIDGRIDTTITYTRGSTNGLQVYISCGAETSTNGILYVTAFGAYS
jgi:hypothetical protein